MCGICGRTDDPYGNAVSAMSRAMRHRGPDDSGIHSDGPLSFGATRLSVIDVEGGHQPVSNEDGTVWAAQNGEIYNHPRLQEQLRQRGHDLRSRVDTEVIVHLYEEYGVDCVHALEGMFAFVVWDSRRQLLMICRDRFGEKPLFYAERGTELAWASELTALSAGLDGLDELDPLAVDEFFVYGYLAGSHSIIAGARQLPPGHRLIWRPGEGIKVDAYWQPPVAVEEAAESVEDLTSELGRLLADSVASRMVADVPLGVFLSGGVDSSLIAATAAQESSSKIKTFTVGYDVGTVSETAEARRTAAEIDSEHHELVLSLDDVAKRVGPVLAGLDQPLADQALPAFHAIAEFARQEVTVAVGGEGADELFAGYRRYRWLKRAVGFDEATPDVLAAAGSRVLNAMPQRRLRRLGNVLEPSGEMERQFDWIGGAQERIRDRFYGQRLEVRHTKDQMIDDLAAISPEGPDAVARLMLLDQLHWLPGDVLPKADRASMQVSLEVRTPYLNYGLAEFAATIPSAIHLGKEGKLLLRRLLAEKLPGSEARRPKTGFRVPVTEWLRGPLAPLLEDQVERGSAVAEGWIDRDGARTMLREHSEGRTNLSEPLWGILAFGLWLDRLRGRAAGG